MPGLAGLNQEERKEAIGSFVTLLLIMAGHALLETARDALFLSRLSPTQLPWVYLIIALVALTLTLLQERRGARRASKASLAGWLLLSTLVTLGFWVALAATPTPRWVLFALYAWAGVFATVVVVRFWLVLQGLFTISGAKRIFAFVGAGSVTGAIAGSALARVLTARVDARGLLLAAAALFACASAGPLVALALTRREPDRHPLHESRHPFLEAAALTRGRPYLSRIALLVLLSTVCFTLVDFLFKSAVARSVPAAEMAPFFASVYLVLNLLSLAAQVLLVGRLLRAVAISRVLALVPALLCFGALGVVVSGTMLAALLLKTCDGSLRYSLHRTVTELLYVPLSEDVRNRVKGFIDVIGQRGGQALASFLILAALALGGSRRDLALGVVCLAVSLGWMAVALEFRRHYLEHFRRSLNEVGVRSRIGFPTLDLASLESLMAALSSENDAEVVAALDLLSAQGKTQLVPALILYHPSAAVVRRALEVFAVSGRRDYEAVARRLAGHPDPELRAAVLRALAATSGAENVAAWLEDPAPVVHATALVALVKTGGPLGDRLIHSVNALAEGGTVEARRALARAIRHQPSPRLVEPLVTLVRDADAEVVRESLQAMRQVASPSFPPLLLPLLARRDLRPDARQALVAQGDAALRFLAAALADESQPEAVRRHLPRTLSRFPAAQAAPILLPRLLADPDGTVRFKILRALGRLRAEHPELPLDRQVLRTATDGSLRAAYRALSWRDVLERGAAEKPERKTAVQQMLVDLLADKERLAVERVFRLLGLLMPGEDLQRIHRGLQAGSDRTRESSRELLQNLLEAPLGEAVIGIVDEADNGERLARAGPYLSPPDGGYEGVVKELLSQASAALRALAAYHAGELHLSAVRPSLEAAQDRDRGLGREAIERALRRLAEGSGEPALSGGSVA